MKENFLKSKKFKALAVLTSVVAVLCTTLFVKDMRDTTDAVNLESPFYSNEYGDNMFTVEGHGDLFVNIIRKSDGTNSGPLAFCLNKQKEFPTSDSILYQSVTDDAWVWELDNTRTPTEAQVDQVQRALYAYKYVFPDRLTSYGLEATNDMALYHATQIAEWAILENWTPEMVQIKEDVKTKPQMLEYANKVHALFMDILAYAKNTNNSTYTDGIKVVFKGTETIANYTFTADDYVETANGKGYLRSELMQALPNQKAGYYYEGDYAFTYEVSLESAPEGTRIVNENGYEQSTFSTKEGVGSNFYVEIPLESAAGKDGSFKVNVKTTVFRRNAGILWRPMVDTAYQTLLQNASIPDAAVQSVTMTYSGIGKTAIVKVIKKGEQLESFTETNTDYGKLYTPKYKVLPLAGTKYTIAIIKETDSYFITGEDGNTYVDGQNLIQKGNVVTGKDGIAQFNRVPLDKNRDTTSYRVTETAPTNGYLLDSDNSKIVQVNKTSSESVVSGNSSFTNTRVKVYFETVKLQEYISNKDTEEINTKVLEGAVFGIYANESITSVSGETIIKDTLVGLVTSDENGKVNSKSVDLPVGYTFYVKELKTSEELALSDDVYYLDTHITTTVDSKDELVKINLTDTAGQSVDRITNKLKRGNLSVEKQIEGLDAEGNSVYNTITNAGDFIFEVYSDKDLNNKIATLDSDEFDAGKFVLNDLTPGTYYVKETNAEDSYTVSKEVKEVNVKALTTENVVFKNTLKTHKHTLVKYDVTNGERSVMSGVTFDIKYNNTIIDSVTTKSDGKVSFTLKDSVSYELSERVPAGYEKVTEGNITVVGGKDTLTEVENKKIKIQGSIEITKTDKVSKKALENVGFALYRADDTNYEAALTEDVTNQFGKITFSNLAPDKYVLVETVPLTGYLPIKNISIDLTEIKDGETVKIDVENEKYYGNIEILKTDAVTKEVLKGAVLGLYANESIKEPIAQVTTGDDGKASISNVPYGIYYIGEIKAPVGYELSDKRVIVDVTDMSEETVSVEFTNKPINGNLELLKKDNDTDELLEGAVFKLYESTNGNRGAYVTTLTTNEDGYALYEGIYQREYILEEVSAPTGYIISNNDIVVDASMLQSGQTIKVTAYNIKKVVEPVKGSITIHKVDMTTKEEIDATFVLLNEAGDIVETLETKDGYATFSDLLLGKYQVIEKVASKGYEVNQTVYEITLTEKEPEQTIMVENKKTVVKLEEATITLFKYDVEDDKPLSGVEFNVYKKGMEEVYKTVTTDENGKFVLTDLPNGLYMIVETKPLDGYEHNDTEFVIEISDTNRSGVVSAYNKKIEKEHTPDVPDVPEVKDPEIEIPNTGVIGGMSPWIISGAVMILSAITGFIYIAIKHRKETE